MGAPYEIQTFVRYGLLGRRWCFRIVDTGNWQKILTSEAYSSPFARNETAAAVQNVTGWPIIPERNRK